jgi:hypothetical protein
VVAPIAASAPSLPAALGASAPGRSGLTSVPWPTRERSITERPSSAANRRTMASPRPRPTSPCGAADGVGGSRQKSSNTCGRSCAAIPQRVSATTICQPPSRRRQPTSTLLPLTVTGVADFEAAFAAARPGRAQALVLTQCALFNEEKDRPVAMALQARLPSVSGSGDGLCARNGGLMNCGVSVPAKWRRAATYGERILRGARPAELPVQQPTRFEFLINRRSAGALGPTNPQHRLLADAVLR